MNTAITRAASTPADNVPALEDLSPRDRVRWLLYYTQGKQQQWAQENAEADELLDAMRDTLGAIDAQLQ